MDSKLTAARMVTDAGSALVVADGRGADVLRRVVDGDADVGTRFAVPGPSDAPPAAGGSARPARSAR